jgi:hypothetical protein
MNEKKTIQLEKWRKQNGEGKNGEWERVIKKEERNRG